MKRNRKITFRLTDDELSSFNKAVKISGLSKESFLRTLINGRMPKAMPPDEFYIAIQELRAIGNNINQLAIVAHRVGYIDAHAIESEATNIRKEIMQIRSIISLPDLIHDGNNSNLES